MFLSKKMVNKYPVETTTTSKKFAETVYRQFYSKENSDMLANVLMKKLGYIPKNLSQKMLGFSHMVWTLLDAENGKYKMYKNFWDEVKRINREFYFYYTHPDLQASGAEAFAMKMFTSDSLRPPGLENLNDQSVNVEPDSAWDDGSDHVTPQERIEQYINSNWKQVDSVDQRGTTQAPKYMRYSNFDEVFWQKPHAGRGIDRDDIGDTLGIAPKELDVPMRGYETDW